MSIESYTFQYGVGATFEFKFIAGLTAFIDVKTRFFEKVYFLYGNESAFNIKEILVSVFYRRTQALSRPKSENRFLELRIQVINILAILCTVSPTPVPSTRSARNILLPC